MLKPEVIAYNVSPVTDPFEAENTMDIYDVNVIVRHDGFCTWNPLAKLKTSCDIDMQDFPFDTQSCNVKIGSWESYTVIRKN